MTGHCHTVDIAELVRAWPYDEHNAIRRVTDETGREKLQVRLRQGPFQGILQMELEGRPDGLRPHGRDFLFDHYRALARQARTRRERFQLSPDACRRLGDEARLVYERYIFLERLDDHARIVRDTEQNMRLFRFVARYAREAADRTRYAAWWPHLIRAHATACANLALTTTGYDDAAILLAEARARIEDLPEPADDDRFAYERDLALAVLADFAAELCDDRPLSLVERLEQDLDRAVTGEDYEKAAALRDRLQSMQEALIGA